MKDLEWLKEEVEDYIEPYEEEDYLSYSAGCTDVAEIILELIDQLDELEVEENFYTFDNSKKWLEDNGFVVFEKDKLDAEVQRMIDETYKTMNEKPVIPDYVAAYIEEQKGICSHWFEALDELKADYDNEEITVNDELILEFILKQPDKFVDAYRSGYAVEEKKYYVLDNSRRLLLKKYSKGIDEITVGTMTLDSEWFEPEFYQLTEQEIKDFDERYFAFTVPVEELE